MIIHITKLFVFIKSKINNFTLNKYRRRKATAFTLAELLLAMTVIGVIASEVIPMIVQDVQETKLKTAWKKAFSDFSQADKLLLQDSGGTIIGLCPNTDHGCFKNAFAPKLNITKSCDQGFNEGCWHANLNWQSLDGTHLGSELNVPAVKLSNGSLAYFIFWNPACNRTEAGLQTVCGNITVDVNGFNKPNTYGKDIFGFNVMPNRLLPNGANGQVYPATGWGSGLGLSATYLTQ